MQKLLLLCSYFLQFILMDTQGFVVGAQAAFTLAPTLIFAIGYNAGTFLPLYTVTSSLISMFAVTAGMRSLITSLTNTASIYLEYFDRIGCSSTAKPADIRLGLRYFVSASSILYTQDN